MIKTSCSPLCGENAQCSNEKCQCLPGLQGNPLKGCFDCRSCSSLAECDAFNKRCVCRPGYIGDGINCFKGNGCTEKCHKEAFCTNGQCLCKLGLIGDGIRFCFNCSVCDKNAICQPNNERCVCTKDYEGDGEICSQRSDCQPKCHSEAKCTNKKCYCNVGLLGDGIEYCFNCSICNRNAMCMPNEERCKCNKGYNGDGKKCTLFKSQNICRPACGKNAICYDGKCECLPGNQGDPLIHCFDCKSCSNFATCDIINKRCVCKVGFIGNGINCVSDIKSGCHKNATLINGICQCISGFIGDGINTCMNCSTCDANAICLLNEGRCRCKQGYIGDGKTCYLALQECIPRCHPDALCVNGKCKCIEGFSGDGIKFCLNCLICDKNANCLPYLNKCECKSGYKGNGFQCLQIDQCIPKCHPKAICINFNCHCLPNLIGNGVSSCYNCSRCDVNAKCIPEENRCKCLENYSGNGFTCTKRQTPGCRVSCHKDAICIENTCICKDGFSGDGNNYCFDCQKCDKNAFCRSMEQKCVCKPGFKGDGFSCNVIESKYCSAECHPNATRINNCCKCKKGFIGDGFQNCFDCTRCSQNSDCLPYISQCRCREGFIGDGFSCQAKKCNPACPSTTSLCIKDRCICNPGLIGDGYKCLDCRQCNEYAFCNIKTMKCQCLPGYLGDGINCLSVGGCKTSLDCTKPNEICNRIYGSFLGQCICNSMSIRDNQTNQCRITGCQPTCDIKGDCIQGKCLCKPGYAGDGYKCNSPHQCDSDTDCNLSTEICRKDIKNSLKTCVCISGTFRNAEGQCEQPICPNGCHQKALCIAISNRNSRCICLPGYVGNGISNCVDCTKCHENAICSESQGCICKQNYIGDGKQCFSMNECSLDEDCFIIKGKASQCVTLFNGKQQCICRQGFTIREGTCKPLDCLYPCAENALCILQNCHCKTGFVGNGYIKCFDCSKCHINAQCSEQRGCVCNQGFEGNGLDCKISEQCQTDSDCCDINKICSTTLADVKKRCICKEGFISMGKLCIQKECSDKCHPYATCQAGKCKCQGIYVGDGTVCRQPDECKSTLDCKYSNQECLPRMDLSLQCSCEVGYQWRSSLVTAITLYRRERRKIPDIPGCVPIVCIPKCHPSSLCIMGNCVCPPMFKGNGITGCNDCTKCSPSAFCDDIKGCICKVTFKGNGITCIPEDKCRFHSDCNNPLQECIQNIDTSRICACKTGSVLGSNGQCLMIGCIPPCDKNSICVANKCICITGYTGDGITCKPRDQCVTNSDCKSSNSRCETTMDYIRRCVCLPGFRDSNGICIERECEPKCHLFAKCISQRCHCIHGYFGNGIKICNSCLLCHKDAICLQDTGCRCKHNFVGDGFNCRPLDECRIDSDCRDPNMLCLLNRNEKYLQCFCKKNYEFINNVCQPKKCNVKCHKNAKCISGECICEYGYIGDGQNCIPSGECGVNNPCKDKFASCQVVPEIKSLACVCISGFKFINSQCQPETCPIPCHPLAQCKSGKCICSSGHKGDGIRQCVKCSSCNSKATCTPEGCKCIAGYEGDGVVCQPVDQCRYDSDCRDRYALCLNGLDQAKKCLCKPGFILQNGLCAPIPCNPPCTKNSKCFLGECLCLDGYTKDLGGNSCIENDHCQNDTDCPDVNFNCIYIKSLKGKRCLCKKGYLAKSQFQCVKEGCQKKCHSFADCENSVCKCRPRFEGDGVVNCYDCSLCHSNAVCSPTMGCVCKSPEYVGNGQSCRLKDDCRLDSDCRDSNAKCSSISETLKCICKSGFFRLINAMCSPLPCLKPCNLNQDCINGQCQCKDGFIPSKDNTCEQQHECSINKSNSCKNPNEICIKLSDSNYKCLCKPGFANKFGYCLPINCYQPCHVNAFCNDGKCTCNTGYNGDGITSCIRNDECDKDSDCVIPGFKCANVNKSKKCVYPKDVAINEEKRTTKECPKCDINAVCVNGKCVCNPDFIGNGFMCVLKNECEPQIGCQDPNALCTRGFPIPYFKCLCKPGYIALLPQTMCQPIGCNPDCHVKANCIMGLCVCIKPMIGDGIKECKLPDECSKTLPCPDSNAICIKSLYDNYKCICKETFKLEKDKCVFGGECKINTDCNDKHFCINSKCTCPDPYILEPLIKTCDLPKIAVSHTKQEVLEGSDTEFICFFDNGIGNINFLTWRKISPLMNINFIRQSASIKIKIEKATVLNSGIYQCCISIKNQDPLYCQSVTISVFTAKCGRCDRNMHCDPLTNKCICDAGFQLDYNQICKPRNCFNFPDICDKITMNCESGTCVCKSEYFLSMKVCTPKDQCQTDKDCAPQAICKTDKRCHCGPLYIGPGKICDAINLGCEVTKDCDPNAICVQIGVSPTRICQCNSGFIGDGKSCKPSGPIANLLISQGAFIWKLPSVKRKKRSIYETKSFNPFSWKKLSPGNEISLIETDCKSRTVFWLLTNRLGIFRAPYSSPEVMKPALLTSMNITSISTDYISGNLFWTSKSDKTLGMINFVNGFWSIIFFGLSSPGQIVVNSKDGEIFWISESKDFPKIEFSYMDGNGYKPLITEFKNQIISLAYDIVTDYLCWIETEKLSLFSTVSCLHKVVKEATILHERPLQAYSSTINQIAKTEMGNPFAIKAYYSKIIWITEEDKNYLYIYESKKVTRYVDVKSLSMKYSSVAIFPDACEPLSNSCSEQNMYGNCRYICLPSKNKGRMCVCPQGMQECNKYQ